jgi:hypothetical protein
MFNKYGGDSNSDRSNMVPEIDQLAANITRTAPSKQDGSSALNVYTATAGDEQQQQQQQQQSLSGLSPADRGQSQRSIPGSSGSSARVEPWMQYGLSADPIEYDEAAEATIIRVRAEVRREEKRQRNESSMYSIVLFAV